MPRRFRFGVTHEQGKFEFKGGALAEACADGVDAAAVLGGDGVYEEGPRPVPLILTWSLEGAR